MCYFFPTVKMGGIQILCWSALITTVMLKNLSRTQKARRRQCAGEAGRSVFRSLNSMCSTFMCAMTNTFFVLDASFRSSLSTGTSALRRIVSISSATTKPIFVLIFTRAHRMHWTKVMLMCHRSAISSFFCCHSMVGHARWCNIIKMQ